MPYTIKSQQIAVKDPDTGEYVGVDLLTEQTTEGLLNEINVLANNKKNEITQLGDGKKQAITDEATSQTNAITQLGNSKKQAITDEGTAQVQSINSKGQEVLASIPNDYTELTKTVESLARGSFMYDTASGITASFEDGADGVLIKSLIANIDPQLTGYTEVNVGKTGASLIDKSNFVSGTFVSGKYKPDNPYVVVDLDFYYFEAGTYYFESKFNTVDSCRVVVVSYSSPDENNFITYIGNGWTSNPLIFTLENDTYIRVGARPGTSGNSKCTPNDLAYVRVEKYSAISVNWQSSAGTVHGGTIDIISGKLNVDCDIWHVTTFADKSSSTVGDRYYTATNTTFRNGTYALLMCDKVMCPPETYDSDHISARHEGNRIYVQFPLNSGYETLEKANSWLTNNNGIDALCPLAEPNEYQLTPQEVECFLGVNNIWADTGDVTVTYPVDTKTYIDKKIQEAIDGLSGS